MKRASSPPARGRTDQRGIALVAAILLLLLTSVLAATFIATTSSERSIASNVHVARASLVAADAGVRAAQQRIANQGWFEIDSCARAWNGVDSLVVKNFNRFQQAPYVVTSTNPPFTASATIAFEDTSIAAGLRSQMYDYAYTITATGGYGAQGSRTVQSTGILTLSVQRGSFADFLIFTNTHLTPSGGAIWFSSGTRFDGRVHTNGEFRFAFQPEFQDLVTSVNNKAWYNNKNNPIELAANNNGTIDNPIFGQQGFTRGAPTVTLPANAFNQQGAALSPNLNGMTTAPSNTLLNQYCRPGGSGALPTNVYLPEDPSTGALGGIYVQGSVDSLYMFPSGTAQVYHFRQGTTMSVITVDYASGNTTFAQKVGSGGWSSNSYGGIPDGSLFVNGGISMLGGPPRSGSTVNPAIQDNTQLCITATSDIVIQRDIMYQDYDPNGGNNVLGIYSQAGNVRIGTNAPDDMNVDAYVMATGTNGAFQVDNYSSGSPRGTFHLRGGMVSSYYGAFGTFNPTTGMSASGYNRDFHYDRRGLKPPFYPITNRYLASSPTARTLSWKEM